MRYVVFFLLIFVSGFLYSQQTTYQAGVLPEFTLSHKLNEEIQLTGKIASKQVLFFGSSESRMHRSYQHDKTEFQLYGNYKLNPFWKTTAGYQYIVDGQGNTGHRAVEQIAYVLPKTNYRLGHRFRTDQTFMEDEPAEYRFRYRLSIEIPLQGQTLNIGEYYGIVSNEVLYSIQSPETDLENRLVISMGRYISNNHKVEIGFDYRTDKYLQPDFRNRLWLNVEWYMIL
jgi:hypothetical protein